MSIYRLLDPDPGELFAAAEAELQAVATKYGFDLKLIQDNRGTWFFYPEADEGSDLGWRWG